jgi:hypothetical protein
MTSTVTEAVGTEGVEGRTVRNTENVRATKIASPRITQQTMNSSEATFWAQETGTGHASLAWAWFI